jgi:hypothetical protein
MVSERKFSVFEEVIQAMNLVFYGNMRMHLEQ